MEEGIVSGLFAVIKMPHSTGERCVCVCDCMHACMCVCVYLLVPVRIRVYTCVFARAGLVPIRRKVQGSVCSKKAS